MTASSTVQLQLDPHLHCFISDKWTALPLQIWDYTVWDQIKMNPTITWLKVWYHSLQVKWPLLWIPLLLNRERFYETLCTQWLQLLQWPCNSNVTAQIWWNRTACSLFTSATVPFTLNMHYFTFFEYCDISAFCVKTMWNKKQTRNLFTEKSHNA